MKALFKGIDAVKHKLNLTRVQLALREKRLSTYETLGAKGAYRECLIEVNESKIEILQLENKIIKHNNHVSRNKRSASISN